VRGFAPHVSIEGDQRCKGLDTYTWGFILFSMIIFLYGPDSYRARKKLKEIIRGYETSNRTATNITLWDCSQIDFAELRHALRAQSIFKEKKLFVLEYVFSNTQLARDLAEHKESLLEGKDHIIVFFEEGDADKRSTLFKYLNKAARTQEFSLLAGAKLRQWIQEEFANYQVRIQPGVAEKLEKDVGSDLWQLSNEIHKIVAFSQSKLNRTVEEKDVDLLVKPKIDTNIFATIDALAAKNKKKALALIAEHMEKNDSALYIFSMLAFQFRNLLIVKDMIERRIPYAKMASKLNIHPYVLKKSYEGCERFTKEELENIYKRIFDIDLQAKTGKIDPEEALYVFAAEI